MVRFPVTINKSSSLQCFGWSQLRKTSPRIGKHIGKLRDSKLVTLVKSAWVFSKYLGFSMCPACWAQLSKRHSLYLRIPCCRVSTSSYFETASPFWMYLDLMKVGVTDQELKWGILCLPGGSCMHGVGGGCCVQSRGIVGERKTLNTLQKQTPQSSMAYSDALTMKLREKFSLRGYS